MDRIRSLSKGLTVNHDLPGAIQLRRSYLSLRHKEPRKLSWQWLPKETPEITDCKDLCFPKKCPKPSFFPRWKKSYIPTEKKSCAEPKNRKMTWTEYFSFLFPDPVSKPPLVTCRKLQAERRRACSDPRQYPGYCLNENCCPPLTEWYGQAVVYQVPSPFPELQPAEVVRPCVVPLPIEKSDVCPSKKEFNMDEYAYNRPYNQVCGCESEQGLPLPIRCSGPCYDNKDKVDKLPICRNFSDYKEYKPPQSNEGQSPDIPILVCKSSEEPEKPSPKEANVEAKKTLCERPSFLKPFQSGPKLDGMSTCKRKMHTLSQSLSETLVTSVRSYSSSDKVKSSFHLGPTEWDTHSRGPPTSQPAYKTWDNPPCTRLPSYANNIKTYGPNDFSKDGNTTTYNSYKFSEIDPQLLKLAEETSKKFKHASSSNEADGCPPTLLQKLSEEAKQKYAEKAKNSQEPLTVYNIPDPQMKNKFSLCKTRMLSMGRSVVKFSTSAAGCAAKKGSKKEVCAGCPGIRELAEEMENPKPKPAIDCKSRPAGKCRVYPKEGVPLPDNPYQRNRAKRASICNKPRPPVCKKERPHKVPCEDTRRKYHTTAFLRDQAAFTPLAEIMKESWVQKEKKNSFGMPNSWDSHTADSYLKTDGQISESKQNKCKFTDEDSRKTTVRNIPTFSKIDEWDSPIEESYNSKVKGKLQENVKTDSVMSKLEKASQSRMVYSNESVVKEATPVNIWEKGSSHTEESKPAEPNDDSTRTKRPYIPFQRSKSADNKPTKFSMLFMSNSSETEHKTRSAAGHATRSQARDFLNPLEE